MGERLIRTEKFLKFYSGAKMAQEKKRQKNKKNLFSTE